MQRAVVVDSQNWYFILIWMITGIKRKKSEDSIKAINTDSKFSKLIFYF